MEMKTLLLCATLLSAPEQEYRQKFNVEELILSLHKEPMTRNEQACALFPSDTEKYRRIPMEPVFDYDCGTLKEQLYFLSKEKDSEYKAYNVLLINGKMWGIIIAPQQGDVRFYIDTTGDGFDTKINDLSASCNDIPEWVK